MRKGITPDVQSGSGDQSGLNSYWARVLVQVAWFFEWDIPNGKKATRERGASALTKAFELVKTKMAASPPQATLDEVNRLQTYRWLLGQADKDLLGQWVRQIFQKAAEVPVAPSQRAAKKQATLDRKAGVSGKPAPNAKDAGPVDLMRLFGGVGPKGTT